MWTDLFFPYFLSAKILELLKCDSVSGSRVGCQSLFFPSIIDWSCWGESLVRMAWGCEEETPWSLLELCVAWKYRDGLLGGVFLFGFFYLVMGKLKNWRSNNGYYNELRLIDSISQSATDF